MCPLITSEVILHLIKNIYLYDFTIGSLHWMVMYVFIESVDNI